LRDKGAAAGVMVHAGFEVELTEGEALLLSRRICVELILMAFVGFRELTGAVEAELIDVLNVVELVLLLLQVFVGSFILS